MSLFHSKKIPQFPCGVDVTLGIYRVQPSHTNPAPKKLTLARPFDTLPFFRTIIR